VPRKLSKTTREIIKDNLVDQTTVDTMVAAVARNDRASQLQWYRRRQYYRLCTPYGVLHVRVFFAGCWHVWRDRTPLVHANTPTHAVFTDPDAAKTFALVHVSDGWTGELSTNDGLRWKPRS
jgi:hypothetical protein